MEKALLTQEGSLFILIPFSGKGFLNSSVQLLRCIVPHLFLSVVNRRRLTDNGKVPSGTDGNVVADNLISQVFRIFLLKAQSVLFLLFIPVFQSDHKINALGILNA